jgi:arginase
MHGMPLAALWGVASETTGQQDKEWKELIEVVGQYKLRKHGTAWLGLRDVDPGECVHMGEPMLCLPMTMQDVDRRGIAGCMQTFDRWMWEKGIRNLWISFDVDSLDPILAPGTGTAVRGGLSYREGHLLAELLCELLAMKDCPYKLVGVDVVETNPIYDTNNATAIVAVEWIASLFGKTILGKR